MRFNSLIAVFVSFLFSPALSIGSDITEALPAEKVTSAASTSVAATTSSGSSSWNISTILNLGRSQKEQDIIDAATKTSKDDNIVIDERCATLVKLEGTRPFSEAGKLAKVLSILDGECRAFTALRIACTGSNFIAANGCLAERSVSMSSILAGAQVLTAVGSQMSIKDSCSSAAKALRTMQTGMAAYTATCTAAQVACSASCGAAVKSLVAFRKFTGTADNPTTAKCTLDDLLPPENVITGDTYGIGGGPSRPNYFPTPENAPKCFAAAKQLEDSVRLLNVELTREIDPTNLHGTAGKEKTCTVDFKSMGLAGVATVGSLIQAHSKAAACEKQASANIAPLNCGDPANASVPECICLKSPRSVGCQNSLVKASGNGSSATATVSATPALGTRSSLGPDGATVGRDPAGVADKSKAGDVGGSQAGAPVGGGSGGGVSGTDGKGKGGQESPGGKNYRGLNANIMGGYDGGGSGGGYRGGFRSDDDAKKALDNYRKNMDPVKVAAQAWSKEVSPQSGRSNFEKIKSRYNDNRRTLMGQ